jgi:hypothetical protein
MPKLKSSSVGGGGVGAAEGGADGAVEMPSVWLGVGDEEGVMDGVGVYETAEGLTVALELMDCELVALLVGKDGKAELVCETEAVAEGDAELDMDLVSVGAPEPVRDTEGLAEREMDAVELVVPVVLGVELLEPVVLRDGRGEVELAPLRDAAPDCDGEEEGEREPLFEAVPDTVSDPEAEGVGEPEPEREARAESDAVVEGLKRLEELGVREILAVREPETEAVGERVDEGELWLLKLADTEPVLEAEPEGEREAEVEGVEVDVVEMDAEVVLVGESDEVPEGETEVRPEPEGVGEPVELLVGSAVPDTVAVTLGDFVAKTEGVPDREGRAEDEPRAEPVLDGVPLCDAEPVPEGEPEELLVVEVEGEGELVAELEALALGVME